MEFVDENQNPQPISSLQQGLESILTLSKQDEKDSAYLPLGILTSNDRDTWADARGELIRIGGLAMTNALKELESGAILLCLDDEVSRRYPSIGSTLVATILLFADYI